MMESYRYFFSCSPVFDTAKENFNSAPPPVGGTPEGADLDLAALASAIKKRGLGEAAILLLEMHRPFGGVFHALACVSWPFFSPLLGASYYNRVLSVLEDQSAIEKLILLLERGRDGA